VFKDPTTATKILHRSLGPSLKNAGFDLIFNPLSHEEEFWNTAERLKGRIAQVRFRVLPSNMPSLYENIVKGLAQTAKETKSRATVVEFKPQPGQSVELSKDMPVVEELVTATGRGAAVASIRPSGGGAEITFAVKKKGKKGYEAKISSKAPTVGEARDLFLETWDKITKDGLP